MLWLMFYSAINIPSTEMSLFPFRQNVGYPKELPLQLNHAGG